MDKNPYKVLGVDRSADEKTIRSAYKKLAKTWHPDLFQNEAEKKEAESKMKEINEAYDILGKPEKRAAFDAEDVSSVNIYEHYASKETKQKTKWWRRNKRNPDIENEKQRRAILSFLELEYKNRDEIFDLLQEFEESVTTSSLSAEEYDEYRELIIEKLQECIANIRNIISEAQKRQIEGLEINISEAEQTIAELIERQGKIPKDLKTAEYLEEVKRLTEKINILMQGFSQRIYSVAYFKLLSKTWEFNDDEQLRSACEAHKREAEELLADMQWVQRTSSEHKIEINQIYYNERRRTLEDCIETVKKAKAATQYSLQELRNKFWKENCTYIEKTKKNIKILKDIRPYNIEGNFICPPDIFIIDEWVFHFLTNLHSITIPAKLIHSDSRIRLPNDHKKIKKLIFTFETHSQIVDISNIEPDVITREGKYICLSAIHTTMFALIDENGVYVYDNDVLCKLNGVTDQEELEAISKFWKSYSSWVGYPIQIHTWAQVVKKLPHPSIMQVIPTSVESIQKWTQLDKTNFEKVFSSTDEKLRKRLVRLYIALGALNGEVCHAQAEWMISKLDVSKMYRSRQERVPEKRRNKQDPMLSVPKQVVDFVQEYIEDTEFLPYVFAFLENYEFFKSEAKKAKVGFSTEFIESLIPQCIFHEKVDQITPFVKELLETEKSIDVEIADKIVRMYNMVQTKLEGGKNKNIIETVDTCKEATLHYRFINLQTLQAYRMFEKQFQHEDKSIGISGYYTVEAENVFLSNDSHAIEIVNGETSVGIVILNLHLLYKGELFADVMTCDRSKPSIEFLEAVRRALIDQKNCNNLVTKISIGMDEDPGTSRDNPWRKVVGKANTDWTQGVKWTKFDYIFENKLLDIRYKAYRARFILQD